MTVGNFNFDIDPCSGPRSPAGLDTNSNLGRMLSRVPRSFRFVFVGGLGLVVDLSVFTLITWYGVQPLVARLASLAVATVVTWRLNRAFTFDRSGRRQGEEAMRYAAVVTLAQTTSYAVFATLVLSVAARLPQVALIAGAAAGALISYNGHRLFAFAPRRQSRPDTPH
jgi:putative flippase GtrA